MRFWALLFDMAIDKSDYVGVMGPRFELWASAFSATMEHRGPRRDSLCARNLHPRLGQRRAVLKPSKVQPAIGAENVDPAGTSTPWTCNLQEAMPHVEDALHCRMTVASLGAKVR